MTQIEFLEDIGYRVEERGSDDSKQRINDTDKLVIWWKKGYGPNSYHWKCDGPGLIYWLEECGNTLEECLQNFIDDIEQQNKRITRTIEEYNEEKK